MDRVCLRAGQGDGRLHLLLELVEQEGVRASALPDHALDSGVVAALRDVVREQAQLRLQTHRLRHRWLLRVLSQDAPVAVLMRRHSLGRDDLDTSDRASSQFGTVLVCSALATVRGGLRGTDHGRARGTTALLGHP